jgi:hypothetical protein
MVSYEAAAACDEDGFQLLPTHRGHVGGLYETFQNRKYLVRTDFEFE